MHRARESTSTFKWRTRIEPSDGFYTLPNNDIGIQELDGLARGYAVRRSIFGPLGDGRKSATEVT